MADPKGFLTQRERELPQRRPVDVRIMDWREVYEKQEEGALLRQAGRCMDCGIPFCHQGCPLGNLIPEWNDLTWRGDWAEAVERLHATNNFPEVTGRLCPAPCESACVLGINQPPVTIKQVEVSIADRAFAEGWVVPQPPDRLTGRTVAVVGSGPAGLAAAQQLTRAGHTVAVYERDDAIGGLLRYGIPEFKMEKDLLDARLAQMAAEGTRFRPGTPVGGSAPGAVSGAALVARYDAVLLAVGATAPRDLPVPGRDLPGVMPAMDYLVPANRAARGAGEGPEGRDVPAELDARGRDVVIIGGGDTGADCLGTALRQGARSVTQLAHGPQPAAERTAGEPWPVDPRLFEVTSAHEEGGERRFTASTTRFVAGEDGRVGGLEIVQAERVGREVRPVPGTEEVLDTQLVLIATGYTGPERGPLLDEVGVDLDERGLVARDGSYATSVPGVFVAGDAGRGQSLIVWAIAEGRAAAAAIDARLSGRPSTLPAPVRPTDRPLVV
ncbi:glutamate synthase subunit beta [Pseudokineococcus marinus]|uniref:Glutamate synthase subunit beta n=1 Tax=Pseudokineococcus marinus TaxID=351215 RepID=A0A849BXE8_9ACTN|nr:glutamate synthase subunit beta [Pseudokineococcus marinus]NNH22198.1 glutamate synthase subunit beta [Pseudokineococcus marinus]